MKPNHAFILLNRKAAHNYLSCQITQVNNNNHPWDLLCHSPIQSNWDLITSYLASYCYPAIKTYQTPRIWYLRPSAALIQSDLPLSLPFNPSRSLPSPPLSLSITQGAFSLFLQSPRMIIGPVFERSYSVCPTPRAIILIWRCEIAYNFPWCPVTWWNNSRLFFPRARMFNKAHNHQEWGKGHRGVYKGGDVNVTQCLSSCEKIHLEERKNTGLCYGFVLQRRTETSWTRLHFCD